VLATAAQGQSRSGPSRPLLSVMNRKQARLYGLQQYDEADDVGQLCAKTKAEIDTKLK
jgi:hypothetical protein